MLPEKFFDDLASLRLIKSKDVDSVPVVCQLVSSDWQIIAPIDVVRDYGTMTIKAIGFIMIGEYYYSIKYPQSRDESIRLVICSIVMTIMRHLESYQARYCSIKTCR